MRKLADVHDAILTQNAASQVHVDHAERIRVLVVARGFTAGGAERQLLELLRGLDTSRTTALVACFYRGQWHDQAEKIDGVRILDLGKSGRYDIVRFMIRLYREARTFSPQVIYSYAGAADVPVLLISRLLGARVVWSIRNAEPKIDTDDWLPPFLRKLSVATAKYTDGIIANSEVGAAAYAAHGYPPKAISVIPNGINTERFRKKSEEGKALRQRLAIADDAFVVGLVARIDRRKGHDTLVEAAALLSTRDVDYQFLCAGSGNADLLRALKERAAQLEVEDRLHWIGHTDNVIQAYSACDVVVVPSSTEGFPNALCEAMACEVPCIATAVGDTKRILGNLGAWISPGDANGLAREIERLAHSDLSLIGAQLRRRIVEDFSLHTMADSTMRYFEQIVDQRGRG